MPYYHVYIRFLQKKTREEDEAYELDLSKEQLKKNIVDPLLRGDHFMVDGCFIDANNVFAISINETEINSGTILGRARSYELDDYDPDFEEDYIINQGKNVTREFITQLPRKLRSGKREKKMESKNIFIVHGRDHKPMKELKAILEEFGLNSIVLHEQPSGSRTVVEKLEKHSNVGYTFVILPPDDVGCDKVTMSNSKSEADKSSTNALELALAYKILVTQMNELLNARARQNVVLEFGYFTGLLGRDRVCCLHKGDIELPSDMHGIVYIPFKESINEVRDKIVKELKAAGYEIKI